jgi:hypothetical protein
MQLHQLGQNVLHFELLQGAFGLELGAPLGINVGIEPSAPLLLATIDELIESGRVGRRRLLLLGTRALTPAVAVSPCGMDLLLGCFGHLQNVLNLVGPATDFVRCRPGRVGFQGCQARARGFGVFDAVA